MEISNNISKIPIAGKNRQNINKTKTIQSEVNSQTVLPSFCAQGISQINTDKPVSYSKIAEIQVPGLDEKASLYRLENGQKIVICPKKGPTYIKTTYNVGSLNEPEELKGISHFIEHNLFNGSKGLKPKEYDATISKFGGYTNASTDFSYTDYYISLQLLNENSLEEAIKLNAMLTQFPTFPVEQLEKEKEPVKSEIDVYKDQPGSEAYNIVMKNLFGLGTSSAELTLGTKDHINSFTREKVLDYFNTWYTPDNAITVITGDVDTDEAISLVSKYYNKKNNYSKINNRYYQPLNYIQKTARTDIIMPNLSSSQIVMGFAVPEGVSEDEKVKYETLIDILKSQSSKLSKALNKYGISAQFYTTDIQNKKNSARAIWFMIDTNEKDVEDVLKTLFSEISDIANYPPSLQELNNIKLNKINSLKEISQYSGNLNDLLTEAIKENNTDYFNSQISKINALTPEDISQAARKYMDLSKAAICVSHSKDSNAKSIQDNYNKSINSDIVSFGRSVSPVNSVREEIQKIVKFKLPNNIETNFLPGSSSLKSSVIMSFQTDEINDASGSALDVLNILLNRGNAFRSYDNLTSEKSAKDFELIFHADENGINLLANYRPEYTDNILSLAKETISAPNFSEQEFERAKDLVRNMINAENKYASDFLFNELFPEINKYAPKEQRLKELDKLTLADIQNLYSKIMSTAQVRATISAPVGENQNFYNLYNSSLSNGLPLFKPVTKEKSASFNIYKPVEQAKILKEVENNTQADIVQAYKYKSPQNIDDIAKINLLNNILGAGGMSSRLFLDLRENQKLAYSVKSSINTVKDTDVLMLKINTTTESENPKEGSPENLTKALEGFNRNVNLLKNGYVSQNELDMAKTIYKTEILNELETPKSRICSFAADEDTFYDNEYKVALLEAIDRVTIADIKAAAEYVFKNPPVTSIVASQKTFDSVNI